MPKGNTIYAKKNLKDKNYSQVTFYKNKKIKTI